MNSRPSDMSLAPYASTSLNSKYRTILVDAGGSSAILKDRGLIRRRAVQAGLNDEGIYNEKKAELLEKLGRLNCVAHQMGA